MSTDLLTAEKGHALLAPESPSTPASHMARAVIPEPAICPVAVLEATIDSVIRRLTPFSNGRSILVLQTQALELIDTDMPAGSLPHALRDVLEGLVHGTASTSSNVQALIAGAQDTHGQGGSGLRNALRALYRLPSEDAERVRGLAIHLWNAGERYGTLASTIEELEARGAFMEDGLSPVPALLVPVI